MIRTTSIALVGLFLCLPLVMPKHAHACSCLAETPEQARDRSAAIFSGKVLRIRRPAIAVSSADEMLVEIDTYTVWKGTVPPIGEGTVVGVNTAVSSASCGYPFEEGRTYLVYATMRPQSDTMEVSLCSRTALLSEAEEDVARLGNPSVSHGPVIGSSDAPDSPDSSVRSIAPLLLALGTSAVILEFTLRGRGRA